MPKKSLASILKLQLWLHTLLTSLFFIAVLFFFLFAMEDYLHEQQLKNISEIVAANDSVKGIPDYIQLYTPKEISPDWLTLLEQYAFSHAVEIYNEQGNVIHLLRSQFNDNEKVFILALDTSKTNSLWTISDKLLMFILPWIVVFLVLASFLAKRFISQILDQFNLLLSTINKSESPNNLDRFVQEQPIDEIAKFAQLFNQVWQQKIEILAREKQALEYLSHELRTPIQSSLATLELLALKTQDRRAIERLTRSLNRMTRLSNSILYLMESESLLPTYQVDVFKICQQLVDELKPLADAKRQTISINTIKPKMDKIIPLENENTLVEETTTEASRVEQASANNTSVKIVATQEVIETLLSILLTNALNHSNNNPIIITISHDQIRIENEIKIKKSTQGKNAAKREGHQQGFGIGLTIAKRLANKFNLKLNILFIEQKQVIATISNQ